MWRGVQAPRKAKLKFSLALTNWRNGFVGKNYREQTISTVYRCGSAHAWHGMGNG